MTKKEQPKDDKITCPDCLGTGEIVFELEEGEFSAKECNLCLGCGEIEKTGSHKDPFDFIDDTEELDYE